MKDKLLYISQILFSIIVLLAMLDITFYLYQWMSGIVDGDPLGIPFSFLFLFLGVLILLMEYLIIFKHIKIVSLIISMILGCICFNNFVSIIITSLALMRVIKPVSETPEYLLILIYSFLFCGFFSITHFYTYKNIGNRD